MKSKRFEQQVAANARKTERIYRDEDRKAEYGKAEARRKSEIAQRALSSQLVERKHEESVEDWRERRRLGKPEGPVFLNADSCVECGSLPDCDVNMVRSGERKLCPVCAQEEIEASKRSHRHQEEEAKPCERKYYIPYS